MNKRNWFLKTLFGYQVSFVTLNKVYNMKHRPFRTPVMSVEPLPGGLRGRTYSAVIDDEAVSLPAQPLTSHRRNKE